SSPVTPAPARAARPRPRPRPTSDATSAPARHRIPPWTPLAPWAVPPVAVVTWFAAVGRVDPRALSDVGLVSAVHPIGFLALVALALGFATTLRRRPFREGCAAAHVGALVVILFAT